MYKKLFYSAWWRLEKEKKEREIREHKLNEMGVLLFFRDPYNANVGVFNVPEVSWDCHYFFPPFFYILFYGSDSVALAPFCLSGHLSVLLPQFFCCCFFPVYCSSLFFSSSYVLAQLCPVLCDPMDCRPPGSSVHVIF